MISSINEESFKSIVGKKKVHELQKIHCDYFSLMLKTGNVVGALCEDAMYQEETVDDLLKMIATREKKDFDETGYQDNLKTLSQWIDSDELEKLISEWQGITQRLLVCLR